MPIQTLDILLYRGRGFTSWLIQTLTRSPYNHVAVVVDSQMHLVIESNTGRQSGVRAVDLRKINLSKVDVYRLKPSCPVDARVVISRLVEALGSRYDFLGVIWLGILKLIGFLSFSTINFYNEFQKRKDYFCSELVWEAFAADGIDIVPQTGSGEITSPGDIAESPLLVKVSV